MNTQIDFLLHQSIEHLQKGDLAMAEQSLLQVMHLESANSHALQFLGMIASQRGQYPRAIDYLTQSINLAPANFIASSNLGNIYAQIGEYEKALNAYSQSIQAEPRYEEAWFNRGNILYELGRINEAISHYDQALSLSPNHAPGWFIVGDKLNVIGRFEEALIRYDKAISLVPVYIEAWINKGVALQGLKRFDEAISHYDQAIYLAPNYAQAYSNKGNSLNELGRFEEAVAQHQKAIALKPDYVEAFYNLGIALSGLYRFEEAISNYDKAISIRPEYLDAWMNKGVVLQSLRRFDEAIENYAKLAQIKPEHAEAWLNLAANHSELKNYEQAIIGYQKALNLNQGLDWLRGDLLHACLKIADWENFTEHLEKISSDISSGKCAVNPFSLMGFMDNISLNSESARIYSKKKFPANNFLGPLSRSGNKQKICIGYYSPDFRDHPVAFLTAQLFELHNKDRFEIIAFSYSPDDGGLMRPRLEKAFNQFIDVSNMSDLEVAKLSRDLEIDIAVDLAGHTSGSRTGIFAYRAAPIQMNFLGYPGTIGADYIDYIIADRTLIPEQSQQFYTEKVIYLPDTYQPNDQKKEISDRKFTRQELGLPEKGFVFCCFNNSYKILPETFSRWMRILKAVEGSVLWLLEDHPMASENLRMEATKRDIDPFRLIFAKRALLPDHLSRHSQADLFLDTWPYNAHTTASDSLWAGLPILTLMGESLPSRVAASLLNAVGLPELISTSSEQYEVMAIDLAKNPEKLLELRKKLVSNRLRVPLFDTPLFAKNLEEAYVEIHGRY